MYKKKIIDIPMSVLRFDKTLVRASYQEEVVEEYAQAMISGAEFPPVVVYFDGEQHWVADGCYRCQAAKKASRETIPADIRRGTVEDAIVFAVSCNTTHGVRRRRDDIEVAVRLLLTSEEWLKRPDIQVAKACACGTAIVAEVRRAGSLYSADGMIHYPDGRKFSREKIVHRNLDRTSKQVAALSARAKLPPTEEIGCTFDALKAHIGRASIVVGRIEEEAGECKQSQRMLQTLREMKEWADNWEVWLLKRANGGQYTTGKREKLATAQN